MALTSGTLENEPTVEESDRGEDFCGVETFAFEKGGTVDVESAAFNGGDDFSTIGEVGLVVLGSSVGFVVGARRLGPRARPLVLWSSGPVLDGAASSVVASEFPPPAALFPEAGGPRAKMPANAGLKRSASLPDNPALAIPGRPTGLGFGGSLVSLTFLGETGDAFGTKVPAGISSARPFKCFSEREGEIPGELDRAAGGGFIGFCGGVGLAFSFRLFIREIASGVVVVGLFMELIESFELSDRCRTFLSASGAGVSDSRFSMVRFGSVAAFAFIASFCLTRLSLSSSTRTRGAGPPVMLRPAFPRSMLSLSGSGATKFFVSVLFNFPRAFLNSGSDLELLSLAVCRDLRFALKSIFPGVATGFFASHELFAGADAVGEGDLGFGGGSDKSFARLEGFAAGSGGGDLAFTAGDGLASMTGGDLALMNDGDGCAE